MYQFARSSSDDDLRASIAAIDGEQVEARVALSLVLADEERMLHFVGTHFFDLQVVIPRRQAICRLKFSILDDGDRGQC